MGNII
jgi:hypothetical protein